MQKTAFSISERPLSGVSHALDALELLAAGGGQPQPLAALARALRMSKPGAHRLLLTLVARGYVEHQLGGLYRLGLRAWELGRSVPELGIIAVAAQVMEDLTRATDESTILGVLSGFETVYLHRVDAPQAVRVHTDVGSRLPGHCTSTGLALLAALPKAELAAILPPMLPPISAESITSHDALHRELERTRARGYAMNRGGWRIDVAGVAATILDPDGHPAGGLCIALPRYRATNARLQALGGQVRGAANRIATALAGDGDVKLAGIAR